MVILLECPIRTSGFCAVVIVGYWQRKGGRRGEGFVEGWAEGWDLFRGRGREVLEGGGRGLCWEEWSEKGICCVLGGECLKERGNVVNVGRDGEVGDLL
jgi:hypothetical protein